MRTAFRLFVLCWLLAPAAAPAWAQEAGAGSGTGSAAAPSAARPSASPFLVKPYLQLGNQRPTDATGGLVLLWHTDDVDADWAVEYQPAAGQPWRRAESLTARRVAVPTVEPHRVYRAGLRALAPGRAFAYRVLKAGQPVFSAEGRACKAADQPYRFVAFGDCAAGTFAQKEVAYQAYRAQPDLMMIPGDIVYSRGRIAEYRTRFWPVYNADQAAPGVGAPLLRSTLFVAAPGNHDIAGRDLKRYPDSLAYFLYWDQPRNGPLSEHMVSLLPGLDGPAASQRAFLDAAGEAFPRMANFSFDYGNAHWTIIDANPYMDWTDPELRSWVERDLASARGATWRFVAFHHPGFNSAKSHFDQQQMRLLAEVFEAGGVDIVFSGHVHNYQRTYPLRFVAERSHEGKPVRTRDRVNGRWTLDRSFDGRTRTRPEGIIYLVTGAGGANLYNPEQQENPGSWQEFTAKYQAKVHSLTVADVNGSTLSVRQVSATGEELDRFVVTK